MLSLKELMREIEKREEIPFCLDICQFLEKPDEEKCNLFRDVDREIEDRLSRYGVAVLLAPTGVGKTTYLLLKSMCSQDKVIFFTSSKIMRIEILKRLGKLCEVPRKIMIVFPKYMSCINEEAKREVVEKYRGNIISLYMFKCSKCPFNEKEVTQSEIDKINIKNIVTNYPEEKDINVTNLYEIGKKLDVCPFKLIRAFLDKVDIVVLDHTYLIHRLLPEIDRLCENSLVILDEAHVNYYSWKVHKVSFTSIKSILRKLGLKSEVKIIDELEGKAINLAKRFHHEYEEQGYVVFSTYDDAEVKLIVDEVIRIVKERVKDKDLEKVVGIELNKVPREKGKPKYIGLITLKYMLMRGIPFEPFLVVKGGKCYIYYVRKPFLRYPHKKLIISSATLTKIDIATSLRTKVEDVENFIVVAKLPFVRNTYIVNEDTSLNKRDYIASKLRDFIIKTKPVIIANLSWLEKLRDIKLHYEVKQSLEDRLKVINEVKQYLGREPILLSPYTSYAWGLDLVDYNEPINLNVVVFENPPKKCVENDVIVKFYALNIKKVVELAKQGKIKSRITVRDDLAILKYATLMTMIKKGVCYSLQALGRFQRNHKLHKLNVIFIGKHIKQMLELFMYTKMFNQPKETTIDLLTHSISP